MTLTTPRAHSAARSEGPTRRRVLSGAGAAFATALLAGCGHKPHSASGPLRVAVVGKGETDNRLLFKAAGIVPDFPVSYAEFESGHLVVEALNSGALDLGGMSEIPPIFAAASTVQSFSQIAVYRGDVNNQVILVPKGSSINSLADLRGRKVGYVRGTTTQYFLIGMLQSAGLSWSDIQPVAMTVADGAAAFSHGGLDAWAIYGFPIERAIAADGARILKTALGFLSGNYIVAAHKDAVADPARADLIARYLRLQSRAYDWAAAHQDSFAPEVAKAIGVPVEFVRAQFARRSDPWQLRPVTENAIRSQQQVADVFAAAALIPHKVDVRPLWDARFNALLSAPEPK